MRSWVQVWQVLGFASLGVLDLFSLRLLAGASTVKRPPEMEAKSMKVHEAIMHKIDENQHLMVTKPTLRGPGGPFGARGCPRGETWPKGPKPFFLTCEVTASRPHYGPKPQTLIQGVPRSGKASIS